MKNIQLNIQQHEGGFFSNFNKVIAYISECTDNISKITWNLHGQPYGAFAYNCGEVFGKLFEEYNDGRDIDEIINLDTYSNLSYTGKDVHHYYIENNNNWRVNLNKALKYLTPTAFLQDHIDKIAYKYLFSSDKINLISVLKRNELLKCEQKNGVMPTIDEYFTEIDKLITNDTYLYLAVDNLFDLDQFIKRYKKCIYNTKMRRTNVATDVEPHFIQGTIDDAAHTYVDVYALSLSKYLIHPISNMSTAALYFNPNLISIYI